MSSTAAYAFADALLALSELGHQDVAERLAQRWSDIDIPADLAADLGVAPRVTIIGASSAQPERTPRAHEFFVDASKP